VHVEVLSDRAVEGALSKWQFWEGLLHQYHWYIEWAWEMSLKVNIVTKQKINSP